MDQKATYVAVRASSAITVKVAYEYSSTFIYILHLFV